jgi:hypothetical protein
MNSSIFWYIMPRSPLKVIRRFKGTYCLHLLGRRISQERYQNENRGQAETLRYIAEYYTFSSSSALRISDPADVSNICTLYIGTQCLRQVLENFKYTMSNGCQDVLSVTMRSHNPLHRNFYYCLVKWEQKQHYSLQCVVITAWHTE